MLEVLGSACWSRNLPDDDRHNRRHSCKRVVGDDLAGSRKSSPTSFVHATRHNQACSHVLRSALQPCSPSSAPFLVTVLMTTLVQTKANAIGQHVYEMLFPDLQSRQLNACRI